MTTFVAQIAPQRSTQYASLATALAPHELRCSPLGPHLTQLEACTLGGQPYLKFALRSSGQSDASVDGLTSDERHELGMFAMLRGFFCYYESLAGEHGPFLRPLDTPWQPVLPAEVVMTRRYAGKTNEMFTHFLCNVARFSSEFHHQPWRELRLLDPLAGGGTTLLTGLMLGADVAGVEARSEDAQSTAAFLRQYTREEQIACQEKEETFKKLGRRWLLTIGREARKNRPAQPQQCVIASGDTQQAAQLLTGIPRHHLLVADLPYGIQHHLHQQDELSKLLLGSLPVWQSLLHPGGSIVLSWDATRFPREKMVELVASQPQLLVRNEPPYNQMAHRVDRVIKERDVIVAVKKNQA